MAAVLTRTPEVDDRTGEDQIPAAVVVTKGERAPGRASIFREFPLGWSIWWILLPNSFAIAMMAIGGPSNAFVVLACGLAALAIASVPRLWVRRVGFVLLSLVSSAMYVALLFNIDPQKALVSIPYLLELDPAQSPEYVAGGVAFALLCLTGAWLGARLRAPEGLSAKIAVVGGLALLVNLTAFTHSDARGTYRTAPPAGAPVDSAVIQNRIAPAIEGKRNLVVIMVESLGEPANLHDRALFDAIWGAQRWSGRYEASYGKTAYYGSTTNAELRELCGVWSDYTRADFAALDCLPARFARAGYATASIHAFNRITFDREHWYPKIGIQQQLFAPELWQRGSGFCRGVFPGACDRDIPRIIGQQLRKAEGRPQFVYWLTLNSHLPVPANGSLGTADCHESDARWSSEFPMLCRGYHLNRELADALAAEIMRSDFPPTDFLIVGDHMPPYFQRYLRERFDSSHVPWIMLRYRGGQGA